MAKSLLNDLLGWFGIKLYKPITKVLLNATFDKYIQLLIISYKPIGKNKVLVNYIPKLYHDIISRHKIDFVKVAYKYKDEEIQ